jgi:16S rRNA (guanine527-N7)-methyltransferase
LIRESLTSIRAIDIGTGAGFPGIPVAIAQPQWRLTLLDSTRKKIQFLDQLLRGLRTLNATTLIERVENIGQSSNYRETYDVALIRAVSGASVCAEYALPLLKVGGLAVLYRGQWTEKETLALRPAVEKLGGQIELVEAFKTPLTESDRHCLYLRKVTSTPKEFPRGVGLAVQKPLEETL